MMEKGLFAALRAWDEDSGLKKLVEYEEKKIKHMMLIAVTVFLFVSLTLISVIPILSIPFLADVVSAADSSCADSDNGLDYAVRGYATAANLASASYDFCYKNVLYEFYCMEGEATVWPYPCPGGCSYGACLSGAGTTTTRATTTTTQPTVTTLPSSSTFMAYMTFNELSGLTARDSSGQGRDGAITGATWSAAGVSGGCLTFDGDKDYVMLSGSENANSPNAFTLSAWINPAKALENANAGVAAKANVGVGWSWQLRYGAPGGYLGFQFNTPEGSKWISVKQALTAGKWYHVVGSYDGSTARMYLNGELKDSIAVSGIVSSNAPIFIGEEGWANSFNGRIDDVKIYSQSFNADQIRREYEKYASTTPTTSTTAPTTPTTLPSSASLLDKINYECANLKVSEPTWLWNPSKTVYVAAKDASTSFKSIANYKCDGSGDQIEIQAAISAAGAGGRVILSEGNFYFSSKINIDRKLILQGQGSGKTIIRNGGVDVRSNYVYVKGFKILGGSGVFKVYNSHISVRDVVMQDMDQYSLAAFYVWGGTGLVEDIEFIECKAIDCARYGFINSAEKTINSIQGKGMKNLRFIKCAAINSCRNGCYSNGPWCPWCPGFDILEQGNIVDSQYICCNASGSQESGFHEETGKPSGAPIRYLSNILIKNCISVNNAQKTGDIYFGAGYAVGTGTRLENCYSANNMRGFLLAGGGSTMVHDVSCVNCVDEGSDVGFFVASGYNFNLQNCESRNAGKQALTVSRLWDSTITGFKAINPKGGSSDGTSTSACVKFASSSNLVGLVNNFNSPPHDIKADLDICGCGIQNSLYVSGASNLVFTGEITSKYSSPAYISGSNINTAGLKKTVGSC